MASVERAVEVRDGDDGEFEPLGAVHGHDPDPWIVLCLHRRLSLALVAPGALVGLCQEGAEVAPSLPSNSAASRISFRTFAMRPAPCGRASSARS